MKQASNTTLKIPLLILLTSTILFGCNIATKSKKGAEQKSETTATTLQQTKEDLLVNITRAVCYSGFRSGQHPDRGQGAVLPTDEQILEDLQILIEKTPFRLIRLYDSGENTESVLRIISENDLDIKVMLGIWLNAELSNHETCEWLTEPIPQSELDRNKLKNRDEINRGIQLANTYHNTVIAVNVGNEALVDWNDHKVDTDTIISYVQTVKKAVKQPVTVAENYEWWAQHGSELASEVDFVAVHLYPIWEGKDINEGLSYTIENMQKVRNALPKSQLVIAEAGWATTASEFGNRASEEKQELYYLQLMEWAEEMNISTFFFEAFDEDWKGDPNNPLGAEKHWGLFYINREPKQVMRNNQNL